MNIAHALDAAFRAYSASDLAGARSQLDAALKAHPDNEQALWGLVRVCEAQDLPDEAFDLLCRLAQLAPSSIATLDALAARCTTPQQLELAIEAYRVFLQHQPTSPTGHYNLALLLARAGRAVDAVSSYREAIRFGAERPEELELNIAAVFAQQLRDDESALAHLHRALERNPNYVPAFFNLGCIAEQQGDRERAQAQFSRCLELDPSYEPALVRLADAHRFLDRADPLLAQLRGRAKASGDPDLHFALARALEQCGDFAEALAHYDLANGADGEVYRRYDRAETAAQFDSIVRHFDADWVEKHRVQNDAQPVFICGMFRSGSTLVEQILAAHSAFTPAGEREFFARLVAAELPNYPLGCEALDRDTLEAWAASYQEESKSVFGAAARLTDKRPDNFLYLGLIKALFPRAKIVVTRREWQDIAWSIYATRFGPGQHYATDLSSIRHYIALQTSLTTHWQSLFGAELYIADYEALVSSPRDEIAKLLAFLGEEWEDGCLAFNTLKNTVRTESVWQVRQPLYRSSIGRAAPFAALRPALFSE